MSDETISDKIKKCNSDIAKLQSFIQQGRQELETAARTINKLTGKIEAYNEMEKKPEKPELPPKEGKDLNKRK